MVAEDIITEHLICVNVFLDIMVINVLINIVHLVTPGLSFQLMIIQDTDLMLSAQTWAHVIILPESVHVDLALREEDVNEVIIIIVVIVTVIIITIMNLICVV